MRQQTTEKGVLLSTLSNIWLEAKVLFVLSASIYIFIPFICPLGQNLHSSKEHGQASWLGLTLPICVA